MAEVGLVRFGQVALDVAKTTVPRYRTTFSKHQFTQPQLLAILCLMRYEDWTFREAEVRLAEHSELRRALRLRSAPDYTTLYRFLRRLDEAAITHALNEAVRRMALPHPRRRAQVAVDATGLAQGTVSTFFVRRMYYHTQQPLPWRHWLKWLAVVDLKRQLILAQSARQAPWNDCANLPGLVAQAHAQTPIGCVLADAEFDSERNHTFVRQQLCPQHHPRQAWEKDVDHSWRSCANACRFSSQEILPPLPDRDCLLGCQAQTVLSCSRPMPAHAAPPSPAVGFDLQSLPPVA
jgi:hypothetical protein